MNDSARHAIPRRLDDPERWLFWTLDEAAALMGPAVLGLAVSQFVPGLVAGVLGWLALRRAKRGRRRQLRAARALLVAARLRARPEGRAGELHAPFRGLSGGDGSAGHGCRPPPGAGFARGPAIPAVEVRGALHAACPASAVVST